MSLNELPLVVNFFGLDLRIGTYIIAALGIVHPTAYGCTFFMPLSFLMITIWVLLMLYFAASFVLLFGVELGNIYFYEVYIWIAIFFVFLMMMLMILLTVMFISRSEPIRALFAIFGLFWYGLNIYFILVVNSHKRLLGAILGGDKRGTVDINNNTSLHNNLVPLPSYY